MSWWNPFSRKEDEEWLQAIDEKLDAKEKALNESIAKKEAYLAELKADVESKKQTASQLKEKVSSLTKTINSNSN